MSDQADRERQELARSIRQYAASQARGLAVTLDAGRDISKGDLNAFLEVINMLDKVAVMDAQARKNG